MNEEQRSLTEADFQNQENVPEDNARVDLSYRGSPAKKAGMMKKLTNSVKESVGAIVGLRYENLNEEGAVKSPFEEERNAELNPVDPTQLVSTYLTTGDIAARDRKLQNDVEKFRTKSKLNTLQSAAEIQLGKMPQGLEDVMRELPELGLTAMHKVLLEHKNPDAAPDQRSNGFHGSRNLSAQTEYHEWAPLPTLPESPHHGLPESPHHGRPPAVPYTASRKGVGGVSTNSKALLTKLASSNDKWARMANVMLDLLENNADQLKNGKKPDATNKLLDDRFSTSLLEAINILKNGKQDYKGDTVQPFYHDNDVEDVREAALVDHFKKSIAIDFFAMTVFLLFMAAMVFYFYFRIAYTVGGLGKYLWYGIVVLVVEGLGAVSIIPYAFTFMFYVANTKPVPPNDRDVMEWLQCDGTTLPYHIRVLIPCYKEPTSVVGKTILAALSAPLPAGCKRTVYLCDDGRDQEKKDFCHALERPDVVYVSGRVRVKGEINGKSANINSATTAIYPDGHEIPYNEIIALFDADQRCSPEFFLKTVPLMDGGKDVGMVLTPQFFDNLDKNADLFNHGNVPFWHYTQVGYDALGIISCTGTNFLVRSRAFRGVGGFPTYTLTEDFALGIKLKEQKWQCRYIQEYLAVGEAPDGVRNCFQQRSRWAKGHFQLFFGRHCPLIFSRLGIFARLMYTTVIVNYFSAFISTPVLAIVPMVTIWIGAFPIIVNWQAAAAVTAYYAATTLVVFYVRDFDHLKSMWFALLANSILFFAYAKAMIRGIFARVSFKVTAKGLQRLAASGLQDAWIHILLYSALLASWIVGIIQLAKGRFDSPLIISMLWIMYNSIPSFLLLYYWTIHNFVSHRFLRYLCSLCSLFATLTGVASVVLLWPLLPNEYTYSEPANMTVSFTGSQFSGAVGSEFAAKYPMVNWRSDSQLVHGKALLLNTSAAGNLTNYLYMGGYWEINIDVAKSLDDINIAVSQQQTQVDALSASSLAIQGQISTASQLVGDTLGFKAPKQGIIDSINELVNKSNDATQEGELIYEQLNELSAEVLAIDTKSEEWQRQLKTLTAAQKREFLKAQRDLTEKLGKYAAQLKEQVAELNQYDTTLQALVEDLQGLPNGKFIDPQDQDVSRRDREENDKLRQGLNRVSSGVGLVSSKYEGMSGDLSAISQLLKSLQQSGDTIMLQPEVQYKLHMEDFVSKFIFKPEFYQNLTITDETFDLAGGFITNMGAASLKATTPIAFSTAMSAWTLLSFNQRMQRINNDNYAPLQDSLEYTVRHGADYLQKVLLTGKTRTGDNFTGLVSRVGFVQEEMTFWQRPEDTDRDQPEGRPAFVVLQDDGASDLAGLVAGGLAAAAVVFKDKDPSYYNSLIAAAMAAMDFGTTTMGRMSDSDVDLAVLYNTTSYFDELAWGSAWLYRATGDSKWAGKFMDFGALHLKYEKAAADEFVFNWDHTYYAANLVMSQSTYPDGTNSSTLTGFVDNAELLMERWLCPADEQIQPVSKSSRDGLFLQPNFTTLGVTANTAFLSVQLAENDRFDSNKKEQYRCWALGQVRYMLGDADHSFVTGYGDENPNEYAQDPAAACRAANIQFDSSELCNTYSALYSDQKLMNPGALVTGPLLDDQMQVTDEFVDRRPYNSSRVGLENNVGFMGALIGVSEMTNADWQLCQQHSGAIRLDPVCGTRFVV